MSSVPPASSRRPTISLSQAATLLGKDWRTVKRLLARGDIEGGSTLVDKRRTYFVYADQFGPQPSPGDASNTERLLNTIAGLERELEHAKASEAQARQGEAQARAAAASAEETNRLLHANQAILLSAVKQFQQASNDTIGLVDDYRALADRHWSVAGQYRDSASSFAEAADNFQDIIGRMLTPDDASALTFGDQTRD